MKAFLITIGIIGFGILTLFSGNNDEKQSVAPEKTEIVAEQEASDTTEKVNDNRAESAPQKQKDSKNSNAEYAVVASVTDGDTVRLKDGRKLRYIGIDTPELKHPRKPVECFAKEAKERNRKLVEGKKVRLVKDVNDTDKYGRLLRYVYVGDTFVNEALVREGFAHSSPYPPDIAKQDVLDAAERDARKASRGLWDSAYCKKWEAERKAAAAAAQKRIQKKLQVAPRKASGGYKCNCSKTCKAMSSCAEAMYQLNTCGCSARDGDDDGVPCEKLCR